MNVVLLSLLSLVGLALVVFKNDQGETVGASIGAQLNAAGGELVDMGRALAVDVGAFIKRLEGFSATPYPDAGGQSTGFGHFITGAETTSDPDELFDQDLAKASDTVARLVRVPLSDGQRAALISLVYNIGAGAFGSSTLLRKLNAGDYTGAAGEFDRWVHASGKVSPALVSRRAEEKTLFLS